MKPLSSWTVRLTLTAATLIVLLAADRSARTAENKSAAASPAPPPPAATEAQSSDAEAVLAVKPAVGTLPANYKPSESLNEIIKMAQAGVSEEVLLTYVNNARKAFSPTPEDIIFLNDLGVSEDVIKALIYSKGAAPVAKPQVAESAKPAPAEPAAAAPPPAPAINGVVAQPAPDAAPAPETSVVVVTQPGQVQTVSYFYDSLAPYGNWVNLSGYGWCWQPTVAVVNVGWQPYCDRGRWVYSNHGWYWNSDYSWGWAAFHYGRWHRHGSYGWMWVPGTVWGPSWVSWRYNNAYCGWAPLPPAAHYRSGFGFTYNGGSVSVGFDFGLSYAHYSYVPASSFCARTPKHYVVPAHHARTVHNNTTVINNYISGDNNTVINQGIARDTIAKVTKTPIREVTVKEALVHNTPGMNPDRITRDRDRDVIHRPVLARGNVQRVSEELRRHQRVMPATGQPLVNNLGATAAPAVAPAAAPSTPTKASSVQVSTQPGAATGRVSNERLSGLIEQARTKSRENQSSRTTPPPVVTPSPTVIQIPSPAAVTPAAPVNTPKPVITDQRLSRERVNQLVDEARAKAREREKNAQAGHVTVARPQPNPVVAKPAAPPVSTPAAPALDSRRTVTRATPKVDVSPRVATPVTPQPQAIYKAQPAAPGQTVRRNEPPAQSGAAVVRGPQFQVRSAQPQPPAAPPAQQPAQQRPASPPQTTVQQPSNNERGNGKQQATQNREVQRDSPRGNSGSGRRPVDQ